MLNAVELESAEIEQKPVIERLMELYLHDFSEYDGQELDEDGLFGYKYLDNYWTEQGRYPYIIRIGEKIAGFVFVREINIEDERHHSIAEFFIIRKYRRRGYGRQIAERVFSLFPGKWHVEVLTSNKPAMVFWNGVIRDFNENNREINSYPTTIDGSEWNTWTFELK